MRVVELYGHLVRHILHRRRPTANVLFETSIDVLQRRADEEVLLLQSQTLTFFRGVVRVQHRRDTLATLLRLDRAVVITGVKRGEIELVRWLTTPQSHIVCVVRAIARNRGIVRLRHDDFAALPRVQRVPVRILELSNVAE